MNYKICGKSSFLCALTPCILERACLLHLCFGNELAHSVASQVTWRSETKERGCNWVGYVITEWWWGGIIQRNLENNLFQCHFVHHVLQCTKWHWRQFTPAIFVTAQITGCIFTYIRSSHCDMIMQQSPWIFKHYTTLIHYSDKQVADK
jgi:hypothetical protein